MGALIVSLGLAIGPIRAAEDGPAGNWKVTILGQGSASLWIVKLKSKDEAWSGEVLDRSKGLPATVVDRVQLEGDHLHLVLQLPDAGFTFDGKISKSDPNKILGCITLGRKLVPAQLERTKNTTFEQVHKEFLARPESGPELFDIALDMLGQASAHKYKLEEVRAWADKAYKAAEAYGSLWQREVSIRIAAALAHDAQFAPVAVEYARRTERLLGDKADEKVQLEVLEVLAAALQRARKAGEAAAVEARINKIEKPKDEQFLKKTNVIKTAKFKGRKDEKNDRIVLVELFTGAECPPCVAADLAFDALTKTYSPSEVVLLQYHEHIPGPDPLANADSEARMQYYGEEIEGTPTLLLNGRPGPGGGGPLGNATDKYAEYRSAIEPLLETPARAKTQVQVVRKGDKLDIQTEVSDLEVTGDKIRLRLALVEKVVRYVGGNQMRFHHHVVRALPGGNKGIALKDKTGRHSATVDLAELRQKLNRYLDDTDQKMPFPNSRRPMALANLAVIAFVQNDATKEILQAAQADVGTNPAGDAN
jgi:hypothetical protein